MDASRKYERIIMILVIIYVITLIANIPMTVSAYRDITIVNMIFSYAYIIVWIISTIILRNLRKWIKFDLIFRWVSLFSFVYVLYVANIVDEYIAYILRFILGFFSVMCIIPIYHGFHINMLIGCIIAFIQAIITTILFFKNSYSIQNGI